MRLLENVCSKNGVSSKRTRSKQSFSSITVYSKAKKRAFIKELKEKKPSECKRLALFDTGTFFRAKKAPNDLNDSEYRSS